MYLLKKVFQIRDAGSGGDEKPFLEHLEDLRIMLTRVVLTLLISTLICFSFQERVMEVLRRPVEKVALNKVAETLPQDLENQETIDPETWLDARASANAGTALTPGQRRSFLEHLPEGRQRAYVEVIWLAEAAAALPDAQRQHFIDNIDGFSDATKAQTRALLEKDPQLQFDKVQDIRLMSSFQPTEAFMLSLKIAFFSGLVIGFPFLLYFILQFVLPGLKQEEKKAFYPALFIGFGLFLCGVLFAYFFVLPKVLVFFFSYGEKLGIANDWRIGYYISFATQFTLLFGLSFELPVVVMTLVKLGILNYPMMSRSRSYAIVAILIIAAILTPTPDIATLLFMALPMIFLYEICIWLAFFSHKKELEKERQEEAEYQAYLERRAARQADGDEDDDPEDEPPRPGPSSPPTAPRSPSVGPVAMDPDAEPDYEAMDAEENAEPLGEADAEEDFDPHAPGEWQHPPEDEFRDALEFEISAEEAAELRGDNERHPDEEDRAEEDRDDDSHPPKQTP